MSVTLKPLGVACNIQCQYCYQNALRDAAGTKPAYDLERIKAAIEQNGGPFSLFGGEALLMPVADLEALWSWGLEKYGRNSVQTNGTLIADEHLRLFKAYKVGVGISLDGPGELNDVRWAGTLAATREATARAQAAVERLCREGIAPGLIVTLHRGNATAEKLPALHAWLRQLEGFGVCSVRLHLLEIETPAVRGKYCLSIEENVVALLSLLELERDGLRTLKFDLFRDMREQLLGEDARTSCVWNACDPYTTAAVRGVEGNGQLSNCDRTNTEGIDFVKSDAEGFERYLALHHSSQEQGGCAGCRYFMMCKGQCPGTAIDRDWRNRTEYCGVWKRVFERVENDLLAEGRRPVSLRPERAALEALFVEAWRSGRNTNIAQCLARLEREPALRERTPQPQLALPAVTRLVWAGARARQAWEPRLARIAAAWHEIEWLSVRENLRRCAITQVDAGALARRALEWARLGLQSVPLSGARADARRGEAEPAFYRVLLGAPEDARAFALALAAGDSGRVAELLGCPPCCAAAAAADGASLDPTWRIAARAAAGAGAGGAPIELDGPDQCNCLWRWTGVRPLPHLPCSFDCAPSVALADAFSALGRRNGYGAEMDWMAEILSWPVEWSALHGIAEIRTPLLKISAPADPDGAHRVLRRRGRSYPNEGATGLAFPYRRPARLRLTASRSFNRGLAHPLS